jgi:hypothetical protein
MNLLLLTLLAQQTVAPSVEAVGPARGRNIGDYNIRESYETGYRFANIDGNVGKYRSDVNFQKGLRLLGTSLTVNSRNGKGKYFDEIILNTQGLGNDPYQFSNLRIEKNRKYRYELNWRLNDYFNPALTIANGNHFQNLQRRMQDHQFTLFPQARIQFYGGYSGNVQNGPALNTANLFDTRGNIFPYFENVRRQQNEYRIGGQVQAAGLKLFWQRGWEYFKEDTATPNTPPGAPLDPGVTNTALNNFRRDQPYHGSTPHWRVNLFSDNTKWFTINGRFTHSNGSRNFLYDELASGALRGTPRNVQTLVVGDARRPVTSANLSFSLLPTDRITISNHTAFHNTKMDGENSIRQITNGTLDSTATNFQFLGIRAVTNSTLLDVALRPWISLQGGYQFSDRRVRSSERIDDSGFTDLIRAEQSNRLNAATAGFRLRPIKGLTLVADGELGRQNRPFYTTSEKDYHAFGLRAEYKQKFFRLAAQGRSSVNFNSVSLFRHSSRSRNYTVDGSWTPNSRFAVDAGYQKLHLDTITGIAYFLNFNQIEGDRSYFVSNVHAVHFGTRVVLAKRLDVYAGFSSTKDTGAPSAGFTTQPALVAAQSFPLTFLSPQTRLSYRINEKLRANFGYQYYNYNDQVILFQDYRAHTGFASVLWSF